MSGKRLYRSRDDRMIAGVCGGLGEYFSIDPTIVRLILLFLMLWGGGGVLVYILAWIVIPEQPVSAKAPTSASKVVEEKPAAQPVASEPAKVLVTPPPAPEEAAIPEADSAAEAAEEPEAPAPDTA